MQDQELRQLLQETHPVKPGQEARAWAALQGRIFSPAPQRSLIWKDLHQPGWRSYVAGFAALIALFAVSDVLMTMRAEHIGLTSADSQAPGIYATAFYSNTAKAQVVWLNGMDPAGDKPTYLDPTTPANGPTTPPPAPPDSL